MRRVLVSAPWTWAFGDPPSSLTGVIEVSRRSSDWGLSPWRARLRMLADAVRVTRGSRGRDCVVLATMGIEAAVFAGLIKVRSPRTKVIVFDFLAPRWQPSVPIARWILAPVNRFLIIRSGDASMLERRFHVPNARTTFLPWPVPSMPKGEPTDDDEYVYSAGWAHRDWPTLLTALQQALLPAKLAPGQTLAVPTRSQAITEVLEMPSPELGRAMAARARVVAVVMQETDLPSGPLVLLDALAMGKAVVTTDVNGTRDYVRDGETALVVPPGDPESLAAALTKLWNDPHLRERLGAAARSETLQRCSLDNFWESLVVSCH